MSEWGENEVVPAWAELRAIDLDERPSLDEMEGWAHQLLSSVGMAGHLVPRPSQILAALLRHGMIEVFRVAPTPADGWYYTRGIYLDPDTPEGEVEGVIAHELTHWWLTTMGVRRSLQEHIADPFTVCWRIPRHSVYRLTPRDVGGFAGGIQALLDTYEHTATPADILTRAAMVCRVRLVVYRSSGVRWPEIGEGVYPFNLVMDEGGEVCAVSRALACNGLVHLHCDGLDGADLVAVTFWARDRQWVAIVATPPTEEALAMGW